MYRYKNEIYINVLQQDNKKKRTKSASIPLHSGRNKRVSPNLKLKRWRGTMTDLDVLVLTEAKRTVVNTRSYRGNYINEFTAEELGFQLNVRVDQVRQALHRLNLQGKVTQAHKDHTHDTNRDYWGYGGPISGWKASYYRLTRDEFMAIQ